jgi:DNA-binding transcriptional LysR family regulator
LINKLPHTQWLFAWIDKMDRLIAARVFLEVVERSSLTQAAERLEMSVAMVSRYLASIEDWLGARLLHRTTRRISLTEAGQAAVPSCRQLLDVADELRHVAGHRTREPEGKLRVTTSASFAEAQLAPALVDFQRAHPSVQIHLMGVDRAVDLVEERIDLAVRITNALDPSLRARRLAHCRSVLCAAPDYLHEHGAPAGADDLAAHRCVAHTLVAGTTYRLAKGRKTHEVLVNAVLGTNETTILRSAVLAGAGIGMLPTYYVGEDLRRGALVRVLADHEPDVLGVHAVYLSRQHQPLALRLLIDFLAQRFDGDVAPWDQGWAAAPARRRAKPAA